ncbi:ParB N-terminal domain-containing protein [Propionivibrio sp.]|uniref:ParB N-terminal domain-containing protein n=1 Tax=Propionivibrio sp. TaxID=2212460 RepID=UPI0039E26D2B
MEKILRDERLQPRAALLPSLVERYKNSMETGSQFPPITLARISGKEKLHLVCGWHRFEAATIKLGMEHVQAVIIDAPFNEARWIAASDNLENGHAYTQRGDNKRVFLAYMHARKNKKADGSLKSYREIEREIQVKKSSLHNWMKEHFQATALKMGEEKAGNRDADAPDMDHSGELLRAIERNTQELENYVEKLSDPEARWRAVDSILGIVERMKRLPMEEPEFH